KGAGGRGALEPGGGPCREPGAEVGGGEPLQVGNAGGAAAMACEEGEKVGEIAPVGEAGVRRCSLLLAQPGLPPGNRRRQVRRHPRQVLRRQASRGRCSHARNETSSTCARNDKSSVPWPA